MMCLSWWIVHVHFKKRWFLQFWGVMCHKCQLGPLGRIFFVMILCVFADTFVQLFRKFLHFKFLLFGADHFLVFCVDWLSLWMSIFSQMAILTWKSILSDSKRTIPLFCVVTVFLVLSFSFSYFCPICLWISNSSLVDNRELVMLLCPIRTYQPFVWHLYYSSI